MSRTFGDSGGAVVPTSHNLVERTEKGIKRALKETDGNILVFLPGKGEINACHDALRKMRHIEFIPLHGDLPPDAQDRAFNNKRSQRRAGIIGKCRWISVGKCGRCVLRLNLLWAFIQTI